MSENKPTREQILSEPDGARLDGWVAQWVKGWAIHCRNTALYVDADKTNGMCENVRCVVGEWRPSRDIAAAWLVVEKFAGEGKHWQIGHHIDDVAKPCAEFGGEYIDYEGWGDVSEASAPTAPLAICKAALLAVLEDER